MKEDGIARRRLIDGALPHGRNGALKCDDVLLQKDLGKTVVLRDLRADARNQLLREDGGCADNQLPLVRLCGNLDVAQCACTQKLPLRIGEGESAYEPEEHILGAGENPVGLVHSSYSLLYCALSSSTART